jgi:acyl dehydratase
MTTPEPPAFTFGPVTRTDIVRYAGASGDMNPLHHDDAFARAGGLPSVIAHGMLSAGVLASFVTAWFGPGSVRRYKVRFREMVFPGDVLTAEGRVVRRADGLAELELALRRKDGTPVVTGTATVVAKGASP